MFELLGVASRLDLGVVRSLSFPLELRLSSGNHFGWGGDNTSDPGECGGLDARCASRGGR